MASPTRYKKGDWKAVCDVCGQRFLMSKLKKRWDGLMVCSRDFETRQPQDFVRAKVDIQAVPVSRPENPEGYDFIAVCVTNTSIAGYANAGCIISGNTSIPPYAWDTVPQGTFTV